MLDAYATRDRRINLRPVLDQAMAAAGLIDDRNGIIHRNAAAACLWDRVQTEVRGRTVDILLSADLREQQEALINRHRRTQQILAAGSPCEVQVERKDGRRLWIALSISQLRAEDGTLCCPVRFRPSRTRSIGSWSTGRPPC